jgi:hypothetical protein
MIKLACGCLRHEGYGHTNTKLCAQHHAWYFHQPEGKHPIVGKAALDNLDLTEQDNLDLIGG